MGNIELGKQIYEASHISGKFTLRSGEESDSYFDKYKLESDPILLRKIIMDFATLVPRGTQVFAGLEIGGIPLSTGLSLYTGIPQVIVRKAPKEYGTGRITEGADIAGKKLCIVEDVITSGGQTIESARKLREMEADVSYVICLIERTGSGRQNLRDENIWLNSLFTQADLENISRNP